MLFCGSESFFDEWLRLGHKMGVWALELANFLSKFSLILKNLCEILKFLILYVHLSEVHNFAGVSVHGDSTGHGRGRAVFGASGHVGTFARIVFFFYQMVSGPKGY